MTFSVPPRRKLRRQPLRRLCICAGPVYRLSGKRDLGTTNFPPIGTPLVDGDIAFGQHTGGHTDVPNWPTFIEFAGRYFQSPAAK